MVSRVRLVALGSYVVIELIGLAAVLYILQVQRAPLPREEIAALGALAELEAAAFPREGASKTVAWPESSLAVSAAPGAFADDGELAAFVKRLGVELAPAGVRVAAAVGSVPDATRLGFGPCFAGEGAGAAAECLELLEASPIDLGDGGLGGPLATNFDLVVAPAGEKSALLLDGRRGAVLRWRRSAEQLGNAEALATATAKRLRQSWFQRQTLSQDPLFEMAPSYIMSFFLVGDCERRVAWDFAGEVVGPYLHRFLSRLHHLFDFEIDSQVIQCGTLGGKQQKDGKGIVVNAEQLQTDFLSYTGEWPGDTLTKGAQWMPPLLHFAAFTSSVPLSIVNSEGAPQSSFAVQGWGVVAITHSELGVPKQNALENKSIASENPSFEQLSASEAQSVASAWVSNVRSWLSLSPEGPGASLDASCAEDGGLELLAARPRQNGIADWELMLVARALYSLFLQRTAGALSDFAALVDSLPDLVVREEVGQLVAESTRLARHAAEAAATGDAAEALRASRRALALALETSLDDTVVAQMFFSWEFKYAVYLPLALPIAVPVVVALYREITRKRLSKEVLAEASVEEVQ